MTKREPVAVLLIPNEEHMGLLKHGPGPAHPPEAMRQPDGLWDWCGYQWFCHRPGVCALVLAWDGEVVVEGVDRFLRVSGGRGEMAVRKLLEGFVGWLPPFADYGTIILLDADGREIE